jgi:hypothetical protein
MSIIRKKHWVFVAGVAGTLALTACSPPENDQNRAAPAVVEAVPAAPVLSEAKTVEALTGLKIVGFGPTATKASSALDSRVDVWASADRALDGYQASLWLNGKPLDNTAVSGVTVTGTVPAALLATPGTYALEIRIGDAGRDLTTNKVDFVVE